MPKFKVKYLKEASQFIKEQSDAVQDKIFFNIVKVANGKVDQDLFKKLTRDIWEFRTRYEGQSYRLLAFWDTCEGAWVVATHGFSKKTQRTPPKEIAHAENIMKEYFNKK